MRFYASWSRTRQRIANEEKRTDPVSRRFEDAIFSRHRLTHRFATDRHVMIRVWIPAYLAM